ncbi:MAG: arginyltransferase [Rhizobiaceae bacterium]|jgi:arginine-tRNA-protein transferase|nr:arginyltransferase [Rhizobiaceae bacterium]
MTKHALDAPQFFLTAPAACPYLPGRKERKVFTHLVGERAGDMNDVLTQGGFRRSQNIAYRPACEACRACISVRIPVAAFTTSGSQRRVLKANSDVSSAMHKAEPTTEQYSIFRAYLDARHFGGGMSDMSVLDYAMMIEDSHVDSRVVEYRKPVAPGETGGRRGGDLIGVALTDVLKDGLSMVYSFFEPMETRRSLGTFMILDHVERARAMNLPYVYLGYWVNGSPKMDYKVRFTPIELLTEKGWRRFSGEETARASGTHGPGL